MSIDNGNLARLSMSLPAELFRKLDVMASRPGRS